MPCSVGDARTTIGLEDFLLVPPGGAHGFSNDAGAGFLGALVFFGIHLVLVGALLSRSGYDPPILGGLLVATGVGYVVDSLASLLVDGYGGHLAAVLLTPAVVGEVGLTLWFLTKGVSRPR